NLTFNYLGEVKKESKIQIKLLVSLKERRDKFEVKKIPSTQILLLILLTMVIILFLILRLMKVLILIPIKSN
ncbi:hypothetical protein, partial [Streptococcus sp. C300]|uniref:hypothetical protein n=1 Tax=Streptococcus sp. C300 TaxID=563036 RepID=UPI0005394625